MKDSRTDLYRTLEELREKLHSIVGPEYNRGRVQEARQVSRRIDQLIVRIMRPTAEQGR
ncbi:MAG: hypothetical protein K6T75_07115 [Acetobacteraceae bacterium]|nr:hypothetical protein [Acetobacteraceae bacterium]